MSTPHNPLALPPLSLYIHFPWCLKKCPYCDFNSHEVKRDIPETAYIDTLLQDLQVDLERFAVNRPIQTIFMGGGTPSLLAPESFSRLLTGIKQRITLSETAEITLEANPGTFESHKFAEFRALGINRLSIGVQTFDDQILKRLGRVHNGAEAQQAVAIAHQAGFDNFNIDLMFGLPDANNTTSLHDIAIALDLKPTHLSFYQLTLEPNTFFYKHPPLLPADDDIFETQLACQALLEEQGYRQYEISAYSQAGRACQHNLNYWQFGDYLGIGAGAHGKVSLSLPSRILRSNKPKHPEHYLRDFKAGGSTAAIKLTELPLEFLMNQLRLKQGFSVAQFEARTGLGFDSLAPALQAALQEQLLVCSDGLYRCTPQGWHFLDAILEKFIPS